MLGPRRPQRARGMRVVLPVHLVSGTVGHRRDTREGSLTLGVEYRRQRHTEREYDKYGYVFPIEFLHCSTWPFRGRTGPRRFHGAARLYPRGKYTCKPTEIHG